MKIKAKLYLAIGIFNLLILVLAIVGTISIQSMKSDTDSILKANYSTLDYCRNMLNALDSGLTNEKNLTEFQNWLDKQQNNITETGEYDLTNALIQHFSEFKLNVDDKTIEKKIRKAISEITLLNMNAISHKSEVAKTTSQKAIIWISITGTIFFLISFVLLFNIPSSIAHPVEILTNSVKEIAAKNYSLRVDYKKRDEFGILADSFNTMAEKLEDYEKINISKILHEKKRIDAIINNMHNPVIGFDDSLNIIFMNTEAKTLSGLKDIDIIGKQAKDIALKNDFIRIIIQDISVTNEKDKKNEPIKIFSENKEYYFEKESIRIIDSSAHERFTNHIGDVIILKNITAFKELDIAKTNFIATISHEMKTPVSSIKMSTHLLESTKTGNISEEQKSLIQGIDEDCNRLLKIISELLKFTQVETGNIQLTLQQCDPSEIVQYALDTVKFQAEQKNISLILNIAEHLPKIKADKEKTAWVLINLLSNAIRYSQNKGSIEIEVRTSENKVLFSVKDNGIGIESRYQNKVFDKYFQVPDNGKIGTGLGLAISKEFIEAQGGKIGLESQIGQGSRFYFYLNT
ncbi:MAG: PAS domain-containing sensor histidine kinase [Bacteroidetes bacterium GWF2_38_335]|nr:MAG: PAS domain-containing sensor histidine kinase [Bacteroidetes bacterium GWF2_38_335]OFY80754.1 MAG: PAS domain-containing sensor histidine kinase [Bacteroidetes bacterium RIFOXYA12_FULL_38_20]HBS89037.1 PAS domain-containing sensor histidine kinase [Bacteroidales bacterium]